MDMESNDISQSREKGLFQEKRAHNMAVAPHACLLQVAFYVKARLCRSQVMQTEGSSSGGDIYYYLLLL